MAENSKLGDDASAGSLSLGDDGIVGNSGASIIGGGGRNAGVFGVQPAPIYRTTSPVSSVFSQSVGALSSRYEDGGNDRTDGSADPGNDSGGQPGSDGLGTGPQ